MDIDDFQNQLLFGLAVKYQQDQTSYVFLDALYREFRFGFQEDLIDSLVTRWVDEGLVDVTRTHDGGTQAIIVAPRFAEVLQQCARWLGATELHIDAKKEEVFADAEVSDQVPLPNGWKWYVLDNSIPEWASGKNWGTNQMLVPEADGVVTNSPPIDWSKWGAIAAWIIIPITVVGIIVAIYLDHN